MDCELIKKNFEKHGFKTSFFKTGQEAAAYICDSVKGKRVSFGGSMTVKEMGLYDLLSHNNDVCWHWVTPGKETCEKARSAQIYITSANGVSVTGELVNIDGTGNRVSETLYGPEKTYFVVGSHKLSPDLHSAILRAKNVSAPKNAMRLNVKTPCVANGGDRCYDCSSPERICNATVILERPCRGMEVEIVFLEEESGY